ncbi:HNH endonuclease signature motif containing protein [uncultured Turicimonas sp.]|uniref:HNH endonuclease signature motif containing protein n=1 Tax=uncultured Turicimonas sp. TaxID=1918607 RepID=UPI003211C2C6
MGFWKAVSIAGKLTVVTTKVVAGASVGIVKGAASTVCDVSNALDCVVKKDYEGAANIAEKKIEQSFNGIERRIKALSDLMEEAEKCEEDNKRPFLTKENTKRLTTLVTAGILSTAAVPLLDEDDANEETDNNVSSDDGLIPEDISHLAISNGIFVGDENELRELARTGQISDTEHIEQEDIERSSAAREAFLKSHGYSSLPEEMEVHHIIPLSEGGADTPENMVLVTEEQHDFITACHRNFYRWNAGDKTLG